MRVIVVGGGLVGSTLAAKLSHDGHDVVIVEQDESRLQDLAEGLDVQSIAGNGATIATLKKAGIESCDLLLASTDSDEVNMVVSMVADRVFHTPRVVARIRQQEVEEAFSVLTSHADGERLAVNPEMASVDRILSLLKIPGAVDVVPFLDNHLLVAGFTISAESDFNGLRLADLGLLFPNTAVLVAAIRRKDKWIIPSGRDEIHAGDLAYFAMDPEQVNNILVLIGARPQQERRVMIAGATRMGMNLAQQLERRGIHVVLFDETQRACMKAASKLRQAVVIHGSATNRALLEEEGMEDTTDFIALSNDHELNVVACLLARRMAPNVRTFALVDNPALAGLLGDVGIDVVISPRLLTVSMALQYARRGHVTAVAALLEEFVEVTEIEVEAGSRMAHKTIATLGLPKGVVIAAVLRHGQLFLPKGTYPVMPHDRVLFVTTTDTAADLDRFLSR